MMSSKFKNQDRWNKNALKLMRDLSEKPDKYVIDISNLSNQKQDIICLMEDVKGKYILEFGSGTGDLSIVLAKLGANVTGIDIGEDLVQVSLNLAEVNQVDCSFIKGNIEKVPFEDSKFDYVIGRAVLHHLSEEGVRNALREACRVLKPGGHAIFIEPIENSKLFDFVQNVFPAKTGNLSYRPSILQRKKWTEYMERRDDRALSNAELIAAGSCFRKVEFVKYYGLLIRINRLLPSERLKKFLERTDLVLTGSNSPFKRYSQMVMVKCEK